MATTTPLLQSTLASAEDRPIFARQRVKHAPPHPVTHLVTSNLQVALVLANKTVQRINLASKAAAGGGGDPVETVDFGRAAAGSRVHSAFLDPLGVHLVLSLRPNDTEAVPELLYLNQKTQKVRSASKVKGNLVTAVAWSTRNVSETVTGPLLLATSKGVIYETELDSGEDRMFSSSLEKYWKPVVDLGKGQHMPITGLAYFQVEGTRRYFVLATTANRMYQFQGSVGSHEDRPLLLSVVNSDQAQQDKFLELPSSLKAPATLFLSFRTKERGRPAAKHPLFPASFGWLTEPGIYCGQIDPSDASSGTVTVDCQLLQFPARESPPKADGGGGGDGDGDGKGSPPQAPKTMLLTEFHAVLVYESCVRGVCLLNQQVVFTSEFDSADGGIRGMARDPISGSFFVFTDYVVHKFRVDREERNVWRIYLEAGDFDLAQRFCGGDAGKLDRVQVRRAQDLFDRGLFVESAMHFAKTSRSFEEIALKFMRVEDKSALLNYLKKKLELVKPAEKTQLTLIVVWLVETYLSRIRRLEEEGPSKKEEAEAAKREFSNLLKTSKVAACIQQSRESKDALYDLLGSHGDSGTIVRFATFTGDYDRVVRSHLQAGGHQAALAVLREQRRPELYYRYGPEMMQFLPDKFVDAVIEQGRSLLSPLKILPSLVVCSRRDQEMQAIRYLEFTVDVLRRRDPPLHNFLLSLYVKHQPEKIEGYLAGQGLDAEEDDVPYDVEYTLRLLEENGLKRESLRLYCLLGQLEEAVRLALEVEPALAEELCLRLAKDDETRRKIWLRIAQHVVQEKNDVRKAMQYLKKSGDLIKIEDILPFFPDFVTIDHFKEAICDSLQEYSDHIEDLRRQMEESNRSADAIRREIQQYKNRYIFVRAVDACCVCSGFLLARPFHLFTCGHRMHTACLAEQVKPYLSSARQRRLADIQADLAALESAASSAPDGGGGSGEGKDAGSPDGGGRGTGMSKKERLRSDLDDLVAHECFFCGDIMIKMVDKPLIDEAVFEQSLKEWA